MGVAHEIVVIDVTRVIGDQITTWVQALDKPLTENHQPLNGVPMRVFWARTEQPQGCFPVGHGVLFVEKEPGLETAPECAPANPAQGPDGTWSYPHGIRHLEGGVVMVVLLLPEGETAVFGAPPEEAKVFDKRLAVYWIAKKRADELQIVIKWNLRKPKGTLEEEVRALNPTLHAAKNYHGLLIDPHEHAEPKKEKWSRADKITAAGVVITAVGVVVAVLGVMATFLTVPFVSDVVSHYFRPDDHRSTGGDHPVQAVPSDHSVEKEQPPGRNVGQISDEQVRSMMIGESIESYKGVCPCPYTQARDGSQCGRRSAYSRPGGASPLCYPDDISDAMVSDYRKRKGLAK